MTTTADPTDDGKYFLINGDKLWCTNGLIAGVIVVMAVTPPKIVNGKERKQITAFIVETNTPGIEMVHRCQFMGLQGIQNGLMRFKDVKVPRENIILGEGEGLKLALMTLNTGRLTLPAASTGIAKWCLHVCREWSTQREQWGGPIGGHESIALKLGHMTSHTFAMEAISWLTSAMADDKQRDIRIEAAMAKYFCTELSWHLVDDTMQIRGGQGYERAKSLRERGMKDWPVERVMRDVRINIIIEGTSEIMSLFIAREALDPHLSRLKSLFSAKATIREKLKALVGLIKFYPLWYIRLWLPTLDQGSIRDVPQPLKGHMMYVGEASRRLAREVFHKMTIYQQKLEAKQGILNRIVDIGCDLFAISATCSYASALTQQTGHHANAIDLADLFCHEARRRIEATVKAGRQNDDSKKIKVARQLMANEYKWLENDIIP